MDDQVISHKNGWSSYKSLEWVLSTRPWQNSCVGVKGDETSYQEFYYGTLYTNIISSTS